MEKSTGLAVIALVIALSSFAVMYLEYLPRITTLSNHIDALEHQIDNLQEQQSTLTMLTVPFSQTFTQIDYVDFRELIPYPSEPFVARSIMITLEYQLSYYEESTSFYMIVQINPVVSNMSTPSEDTVMWHELPVEDTLDDVSWSTEFLSLDTDAEELMISIGVLNATGSINGTITQIIIR
jgi:hypothetical protein